LKKVLTFNFISDIIILEREREGKTMTYYRLIYSDNSVSAWTTDLQSLKEAMAIFTRAILESKTF